HLAGDLPAMERFVDEVLRRGRTLEARVPAYEARYQAYLNHGRLRDGLSVGAEVLRLLGVDLPLEPGRARVGASLLRLKMALLDAPFINSMKHDRSGFPVLPHLLLLHRRSPRPSSRWLACWS